jgi:radical SAM superfamily enzyme YgiQ (UPF0313 family)
MSLARRLGRLSRDAGHGKISSQSWQISLVDVTGLRSEAQLADIVLINPRFEISFWGFEYALPLFGKRANVPVVALPLLAALTPPEHHVTIIDENVEAIDFERCARADIVGVTGMSVQRHRMREIVVEFKKRNVFTVVGGPWVSVNESSFADLADAVFVGEAEETWPQFLEHWKKGAPASRYEQSEKTDMTQVPVPRFDLLKINRYAFGSVQFSRGCPFQCEFCDIIVVFGRRPRLKSSAQILAELDALRALKQSSVFIVDDNLIGNKKAIKPILKDVIAWQQKNGFPLFFVTEASIDLADDPELMQLMVDANIGAIFVGIESTNEDSLRETRKLQNVRPGGTMLEKVRRIQEAGMEVTAGMIVGFDHDDESTFEAQKKFLCAARINIAMVGMLFAIPKTPLHARLAAAGRLDGAEDPGYGTNVIPLRISREALRAGYVRLMRELYEPAAYFGRLDDLYVRGHIVIDRAWQNYAAWHPWRRRRRHLRLWVEAAAIFILILLRVSNGTLRTAYRQRIWQFLQSRRNPALVKGYVFKCALHYHMHRLALVLQNGDRPPVNTL